MTAIGAAIAALMLYGTQPTAPPAAPLVVQDAAAKAGQCMGFEPDAARKLSGALKTNRDLPDEQLTFAADFTIIQATSATCAIVPLAATVSVQENEAFTAAIPVKNSVTGEDAICLLVYLGTAPNGQHRFVFIFVPDEEVRTPSATPA